METEALANAENIPYRDNDGRVHWQAEAVGTNEGAMNDVTMRTTDSAENRRVQLLCTYGSEGVIELQEVKSGDGGNRRCTG